MTTLTNDALDLIVRNSHAESQVRYSKSPIWTPAEDRFIRQNLGWMTDAEMGEMLGRTAIAVHLRWDRDLELGGPSKAPDVYTAHHAAWLLGIDGHKTAAWVDWGLIPGRLMAGGRKIRLIDRQAFRRWVLNPMHWMYFNPKKVLDPELRHMLQLRAKRWGDEWWTTRQAADYHGIKTTEIKRYIQRGELPSFRLPYSLGGRHAQRYWSNHFVRRSDAIQLKIYTRQNWRPHWTPAADAWILKARDELGMTFVAIGRTMKIGKWTYHSRTNSTIMNRYHKLKQLQTQKKSKKSRRRA
jgi:hypothetical protein